MCLCDIAISFSKVQEKIGLRFRKTSHGGVVSMWLVVTTVLTR